MSRTNTDRSKYTMPAFCFASVHQMAPRLTEVECIILELGAFIDPEGMKGPVGPVDKWLPIGHRSSAGQGSSPAKRPTFYHC